MPSVPGIKPLDGGLLLSPLISVPCEMTDECSAAEWNLVVLGARPPLMEASEGGLLLVISLVSEYDLGILSCDQSSAVLNSVRDLVADDRTFFRGEGDVAVVTASVFGESGALLFAAATPTE